MHASFRTTGTIKPIQIAAITTAVNQRALCTLVNTHLNTLVNTLACGAHPTTGTNSTRHQGERDSNMPVPHANCKMSPTAETPRKRRSSRMSGYGGRVQESLPQQAEVTIGLLPACFPGKGTQWHRCQYVFVTPPIQFQDCTDIYVFLSRKA